MDSIDYSIFPKVILLKTLDNPDLFKLHLPNPKIFIQTIIENDKVDDFKQLTDDLIILIDVQSNLRLTGGFNTDNIEWIQNNIKPNTKIYNFLFTKNKYHDRKRLSYNDEQYPKMLLNLYELNNNIEIVTEYIKWLIDLYEILQPEFFIEINVSYHKNWAFGTNPLEGSFWHNLDSYELLQITKNLIPYFKLKKCEPRGSFICKCNFCQTIFRDIYFLVDPFEKIIDDQLYFAKFKYKNIEPKDLQ